ncbi:peptidyl-tRNA hydrolase [Exidia glandulosa HHB12029]|uniref:peptidyl-tRNA hydrolase n=1 Tax=Exidia glandulosa HHB12029 TaxID=1314781 RepID=A0A165JM91_EXIGL|nr:peptidyl-tRNA hydrolase [Exidia glandulosa HHB12029]
MLPSRALFFITRVMPGATKSTQNANRVLVVGLGNAPYPGTRHSVGHQIIDALANHLGATLTYERATHSWIAHAQATLRKRAPKNKKGKALAVEGDETTVELVLCKPKPLMNISGPAVAQAYKTYLRPAPLNRVVVIHDSLSHKPFVTSPRLGGSALGHNGIRSTIDAFGSPDFGRIRVGIGSHKGDAAEYVLERFPSAERAYWSSTEACEKIMADIETLLSDSESS